jgi:hypothetical protein
MMCKEKYVEDDLKIFYGPLYIFNLLGSVDDSGLQIEVEDA